MIPSTKDEIDQAFRMHEEQIREFRKREIESYKCTSLKEIQVRGVQLLVSRYQLLEEPLKHGNTCTIGVGDGEFATIILERCRPTKLRLVDLWDLPGPRRRKDEVLEFSGGHASKKGHELEPGAVGIFYNLLA
jgi:hypothetical protein